MYYNQAILWQGQGKTMQMLDNFYSILSSLIPLFCPYIASSKIIQQGVSSTKHEADMMCSMNQLK